MMYAYPVRGKAKSSEICEAWIKGCGGAIVHNADTLRDGPAFFYGVDDSNANVYREAKRRSPYQASYYYCDNAYFDSTRQIYFRVSRNKLQHGGYGVSDGKRFAALGINIKPWNQTADGHVVVCPQSDQFMKTVVDYRGNWLDEFFSVYKALKYSNRLRVRDWSRDKGALAATLKDDLVGAHSLVTWSSAAAITAVLEGIPAVAMSADCAANPMVGTSIYHFNRLPQKDRTQWAGVLADNQWTLDEFADGTAWSMING